MPRSARVKKFLEEATPAERQELVEELTRGPSFTGADLLALWRSLPHGDPSWTDDVEKAIRSQPTIADEPFRWES